MVGRSGASMATDEQRGRVIGMLWPDWPDSPLYERRQIVHVSLGHGAGEGRHVAAWSREIGGSGKGQARRAAEGRSGILCRYVGSMTKE